MDVTAAQENVKSFVAGVLDDSPQILCQPQDGQIQQQQQAT